MNTIVQEAFEKIEKQGFFIESDYLPKTLVKGLHKKLSSLYMDTEFKAAEIGSKSSKQKVKAVRNDFIYWLNNPSKDKYEKEFFSEMDKLCQDLSEYFFIGINNYEFHYAVYPKGSFYKRHLDNFQQTNSRIFTVILYLNPDWKEGDGGELVIYFDDETKKKVVQPKLGTLVVFDSARFEHEVKKSNTNRFSLTGWLRKDDLLF